MKGAIGRGESKQSPGASGLANESMLVHTLVWGRRKRVLFFSFLFASVEHNFPPTGTHACHLQSSSVMLPRAALMPPCAATVWERVGNSLVMHAVVNPASDRPVAARRPAPPAPTTTASYLPAVNGRDV